MATKIETPDGVPGTHVHPPIVRTLRIDAPIEDVWRAITEGDEIQRWFAPKAESRPGPGGIIKLAWSSDATWDMPIAEWEPPRRLVIDDRSHSAAKRIEYTLESKGGATELRLVHSGFAPGADWDEMYDSTCNGWTFELGSLKHYVENHKGESRWLARAAAPVRVGRDEAWARLLSSAGLGVEGATTGLQPGARFEATCATGDRLTGRIVTSMPHCLGVVLDQHNGALLRVIVERMCGGGHALEAMLWLSAYALPESEKRDFESRWNAVLAELFTG